MDSFGLVRWLLKALGGRLITFSWEGETGCIGKHKWVDRVTTWGVLGGGNRQRELSVGGLVASLRDLADWMFLSGISRVKLFRFGDCYFFQ